MISLGIDIGGTGCKCVAFDHTGVQLGMSYEEYPLAAGMVNLPPLVLAARHPREQNILPNMHRAAQELAQLPPVIVYEATYVQRPPEVDTSGEVDIQRYDDTWVIEAPWLQRLIGNVNFSDFESRNWFDRQLRESGLFDKLESMGIQDGDIVSLYDLEFEYQR